LLAASVILHPAPDALPLACWAFHARYLVYPSGIVSQDAVAWGNVLQRSPPD
jgi:hypothetical protein